MLVAERASSFVSISTGPLEWRRTREFRSADDRSARSGAGRHLGSGEPRQKAGSQRLGGPEPPPPAQPAHRCPHCPLRPAPDRWLQRESFLDTRFTAPRSSGLASSRPDYLDDDSHTAADSAAYPSPCCTQDAGRPRRRLHRHYVARRQARPVVHPHLPLLRLHQKQRHDGGKTPSRRLHRLCRQPHVRATGARPDRQRQGALSHPPTRHAG
jgi:hypothetical protein